MITEDRRKLLNDFLSAFPLASLSGMPLDKYTNLNKSDSFCYWVESITHGLGSIGGGSSYKFGIYKYNEKPKGKSAGVMCDDSYAWYTKNGNTAQEAYSLVRSEIVKIANHAKNGELEAIDSTTTFGSVFKWKIAFLYSNEQLIPIYNRSMLEKVSGKFGMGNPNDKSIPEMQRFLLAKKGSEDLFAFYDRLLQMLGNNGQSDAPQSAEKKYWLYAPGKGASKWELCKQDSIICIGWDELGDLAQYNSADSARKRLKEIHKSPDSSFRNDGLAVWEFVHTVKPGDIIYAKSGISKVLGRGIVKSDYIHDESYKDFRNVRHVEWTNIGVQDTQTHSISKTLTDITKYPDFIKKLEALFNDAPIVRQKDPYTKDNFLCEVYMNSDDYDSLAGLLKEKQNIILQGAPGVGKTFTAKRLAYSMLGQKDDEQIEMVQFHQNFSYEDFIMGYKPTENGGFVLRHGIFYNFCKKAKSNPDKQYFFIIDEINRGNLSKIFGELLMLIENGYRGKNIKLAYTGEDFTVPENIYIIGMMNTADRSLAMIDYALRRRFSFFEMEPGFSTDGFRQYQESLHDKTFNKVIDAIIDLNTVIANDDSLGAGFRIGHSYFCGQEVVRKTWLKNVINYDIAPMLREYWFDNPQKSDTQIGIIKSKFQ